MALLIGKRIPSFTAPAVVDGGKIVNDFSLDQFLDNKYVVLFFYPADFTFVCPTELHAFQDKLKEFEARNVQLVACSVDSEFSHWKWLQTEPKDGGIKGVTYPIMADQPRIMAEYFDVLAGEYDYDEDGEVLFDGVCQTYRGLFLIDKEGVVRHSTVNDMPLGRSVEEALRVVDALQYFEQHGEVCPANWHKGDKGMAATQAGVSDYLANR